MWKSLCITICLLKFAIYVNSAGMYTVIGPGTIRSEYRYSVVVSVHKSDEPCVMDVGITGKSYNDTKRVTLDAMSTQKLDFDIPKLVEGEYSLKVSGISGIIFENSTNLNYADHKPAIFIQTDKAKYKPADLVQFRVLVLDENIRPVKIEKPINLLIIDGGQNRLKQWKNIQLNNGVYSGEFQLSDQPVLGDWSIEVQIEECDKQTKSFEVAKYVLPKFEVSIDTDKDVAFAEGGLKITVRSKYTYGKPVKGQATVSVEPAYMFYGGGIFKKAEKKLNVDGKGRVEFDFQKDIGLTSTAGFIPPLTIKVALEEGLTGNIQNATATVNLHHDRFKIEGLDVPEHFVENKNLLYKVVVKDVRGAPVQDTKNAIKLILKPPQKYFLRAIVGTTPTTSEPETAQEPLEFKSNLDEYGTATFNVTMPPNSSEYYSVQCIYLDVNQHLASLYKFQPARDSSELLKISVTPEKPQLGKSVSVIIKSSEEIPYFVYVLVARGNIVHMEYVDVPEKRKSHTIKFMPTFEMIPNTALYIHYVHNNELHFEEITINFEKSFENSIDISAQAQAKPGENVDLKVITDPNSYVGLLGVDQSVLLLKTGNDLSKNEIFDKIDDFSTRTPWMRGYGRYPGEKSGVVTMTNARYPFNMDTIPRIFRNGHISFNMAPKTGQLFGSTAAIFPLAQKQSMAAPKLRQDFSESWIFQNMFTKNSEDGFSFSKKIPDTITSWIVTGFSVNPKTGLALTENPTKIRVFQPFFISTYLPYSVKRGEIIAIPVIIFNYMDKALDAEVVMDNVDQDYEFVEVSNDVQEKFSDDLQRVKRLTVPSNTGKTVSFLIHTTKVGDVALRIKAITPLAGDAINQMLKVVPEGVTQYGNKAYFVNLKDTAEQTASLIADIPIETVIPDSEYIEFSVIGDLLGPTVNNLDNLVRMPYGCGEQNMVNFVPNILVMRYLSGLKKPQKKLMERAHKYMEVGYQRELTYKHNDGSYSAFGQSSSKHGSTWLTAYVVRSFHEAKPYIDIDPKVLEQGLEFLKSVQAPNGSFAEHGKLFDHAHQSELGLTSFVLLAFSENQEHSEKYKDQINKALNYLIENVPKSEDQYALAIAALATQKANHFLADKILTRLDDMAKHENGLKWWTKKTTDEDKKSHYYSNNDVEVTSYILLSRLEKRSIESSLPTIQWLISKRNSNGGFSSTQDTVMGLHAIIKFAELTGTGNSAVDIGFETEEHVTSKGSVNVNADNSLLMQTHVLPKSARKVNFKANGSGVSMVQLAYRYNVAEKNKYPSFKLAITVKDKQAGRLKLQVCSTYTPLENDNTESNMVVQEIALPSGYTVDNEQLEALVNSFEIIKRVETKDAQSMAVLYLESLKAGEEICINILADRTHAVAKPKPAAVNIYDYYDTLKRATEYYEIETSLTDICNEVNENEC